MNKKTEMTKMREGLTSILEDLQTGESKLNLKTVTEINSTSRAIISSVNSELAYNVQMGNKRKIAFLE